MTASSHGRCKCEGVYMTEFKHLSFKLVLRQKFSLKTRISYREFFFWR